MKHNVFAMLWYIKTFKSLTILELYNHIASKTTVTALELRKLEKLMIRRYICFFKCVLKSFRFILFLS